MLRHPQISLKILLCQKLQMILWNNITVTVSIQKRGILLENPKGNQPTVCSCLANSEFYLSSRLSQFCTLVAHIQYMQTGPCSVGLVLHEGTLHISDTFLLQTSSIAKNEYLESLADPPLATHTHKLYIEIYACGLNSIFLSSWAEVSIITQSDHKIPQTLFLYNTASLWENFSDVDGSQRL